MASEFDQPSEQIDPESKELTHDLLDDEAIIRSPILDALGLEQGPELLGFVRELKVALKNPETDPEKLRQLWTDYSIYFETIADQQTEEEMYVKVQVAAILHKAFIFRDVGNTLRYLDELDKAASYTWNLGVGYDLVTLPLRAELKARAASLQAESSEIIPEVFIVRLIDILSDMDRFRLMDLWQQEHDFEALVDLSYEMLLEENEDPAEVLGELGVDERHWISE